MVAFDFAVTSALLGVGDEFVFDSETVAQPVSVCRRGDEFGTAQIEVAFTGAFLGKSQAATKLELGFQKVGFQPVDGLLA